MKTIALDIVSAEAALFHGEVRFVSVTGLGGELGISPGHSPLLTALKPGSVHAILADGTEQVFYISGGMLEVQPKIVSLLADTAIRADDLDEVAAITAKEKAEKLIHDKAQGMEYSRALAELAEAAAQLRAISLLKEKLRRK